MITSDQIAEFLRANPSFFEHHPEILLNLQVPHPHGGRTVSISERQLVATREKVKFLESKLAELIQYGEENDQLSEKVHWLAMRLIACDSVETLIDTLYLELLDHFNVPHVAVRFWRVERPEHAGPEFTELSPELKQFVDAMSTPYCGHHPVYETHLWFGEHAPHLKSYSMVPLKWQQSFGVLLMASENSERFYPEMGTLYLRRISDLFSACIARHLKLAPDAA